MEGPRIRFAEEWAASAWRKHKLTVPVDLDVVRRGLHLRLRRREMPDDDSGCIGRTEKTVYIVVNSTHSPERQRFTTAHEIAEYLLVRHQERTGRRLAQGKAKERFCDTFAAKLLMPDELVQEAAARIFHDKKENDKTVALAGMFGVSASAMSVRLRELGIDQRRSRHTKVSPDPGFKARMEQYAAELLAEIT